MQSRPSRGPARLGGSSASSLFRLRGSSCAVVARQAITLAARANTIVRIEDTFIRGYRQLALETPSRPRDVLLRSLDVLLSSLFLLLALPVALAITLIVLLTSGRPIFYRG